MVVQECLPKSSLVVSDNIFIDRNGEIKSSFLYASYRVYPIKGGTGTYNITFDRKDIHKQCARLVGEMGLRGAVGVDLMIDSRDNIAKVIEINPRVLACSKVGFIAGVNQAHQVLEDAFGYPVTPYIEYKSDMRVRMSQTDTLWFIKSPDRFKTQPSWFSNKNTKDQTFSWDDPLPWFAFLFRGLTRLKKEEKARAN
jgi:predicted ATP-grasp superfamily ATP-dependent carboligase